MDIIIVCMNQKEEIPKIIEGFYVDCVFNANENKTYCNDIYIMLNSIYGGLYSIFTETAYRNDDIMAGTIDIVDFKEAECREPYILCNSFDEQFLDENPDYSFYTIYFVDNDKRNRFKKLIQYFIKMSATQSCLILFRQGMAIPEKIVGPLDLNTFFEMIESEKIYKNVEYILKV